MEEAIGMAVDFFGIPGMDVWVYYQERSVFQMKAVQNGQRISSFRRTDVKSLANGWK